MRYLIPAALAVCLSACGGRGETPATEQTAKPDTTTPVASSPFPTLDKKDHHSFANTDDYKVEHIALDWTVDFEKSQLRGSATLSIEQLNSEAETLTLDTRALTIDKVSAGNGEQLAETAFKLDSADQHLGSALHITVPAGSDTVRIDYATSPEASGLQWLTPAQTAGKKDPFLFSQAQAIHARSFIPLQDTPKARVTYSATVRTPKHLLAVMSANNEADTPRDGEYHFEMPQAIPPYLIAIAVGDLEFKAMGERTGVYAESYILDAAAAEFADTEQMLIRTEQDYGPYRWDRYDLLILPPSFPFGGMENPRLSFITPTVIAGDKSLVALIAHELAHSWSGNLVTNATWRDLWLNEGFTTYLTNRIMQNTYGDRRYKMEMALGYEDLINDMGDFDDRDEILAIDLSGRDPDAVFSNIPYEKGSLMLYEIENTVGRENFDEFLRTYFDKFAFQSITTQDFLEYLQESLLKNHADKLDAERLRQWIFEPGLPADAPKPLSPAFAAIDDTRAQWLEGKTAAADIDTSAWNAHEWRFFLDGMPEKLSAEQLAELDKAFGLTASRNNETAFSWLMIVVRNQYQPGYERLENFLTSIGRNKFLRPLYRAMMENGEQAMAKRIFEKARSGYHPLSVKVNSAIVNPE
jgi:leukotriene A-4 hydrolase/aminopeptidase